MGDRQRSVAGRDTAPAVVDPARPVIGERGVMDIEWRLEPGDGYISVAHDLGPGGEDNYSECWSVCGVFTRLPHARSNLALTCQGTN